MYTILGKLPGMPPAAEWVADTIPAGTQLGDIVFGFALIASLPDGVVVEHDGVPYITRRKELQPIIRQTLVRRKVSQTAHSLTRAEWVAIMEEARAITQNWYRGSNEPR